MLAQSCSVKGVAEGVGQTVTLHSADKTASLVFFPVAQQRGLISYQRK